ncbi:MAG: sensor histidine kinase [Faecousia sp.]
MEKNSFSLKYRVLVWCFALLLPLVLLLSSFTFLQINRTRYQLMTSESTSLHLLTGPFQQEADDIEEYLFDLALQNRVFRSMADVQQNTQLYSSAYSVLEGSDNLFTTLPDLSFLVVYSESNEFYAARDQGLSYLTMAEQTYLRSAVEKRCVRFFLEGNAQDRDWFTVLIADRWFLCRMVRFQGMYCAGLLDLSAAIDSMNGQIKENSALVFLSGDTPLTAVPNGISESVLTGGRLSKQYGVLSEDLCGIRLAYAFPYSGVIGIMGVPFILLIIIAIVVLAMLPLFYLRLSRDVFQPLDALVDTMERIRDGDGSEAVSDENIKCKEFRQVNHIFNQMVQQIRHLKIRHYEQKIETQQTELAFLQAQIRPHFYLNCLKTLYSLAEQRQYADIETCILLVSKHLRYAFQLHNDTVPMREELSLCGNYVKLYAVMTDQMPALVLDIESALFDIQIPPISLLTLVENSIRVNLTPSSDLEIKIRAKRMHTEDGGVLCLTVQDNGCGFAEEQLELLNTGKWAQSSGSHVGLQNVIRRFRILYGENFSIAFFNRDGAVVEMYLPMETNKKKEDAAHETADCG